MPPKHQAYTLRPRITHPVRVKKLPPLIISGLATTLLRPRRLKPPKLITTALFFLLLSLIPTSARAASLEGFHDGSTCDKTFGWAWDSTQPNTAISVDIYDSSIRVATVLANEFRSDLVGKGNGNHAFNYITPDSLKDGQSHTITVKFGGTIINLSDTHKSLAAASLLAAPTLSA